MAAILARMASQVQGFYALHFKFKKEVEPKVSIQPVYAIRREQSGKGPTLDRAKSKAISDSPSKKTRRGTSKSKSGCQTCKIRNTKCDVSRPGCRKCMKTGRRFDYTDLSRISKFPPVPPPRRSSLLAAARSRTFAIINHPTGHTRPTAPLPAFEISQQDGYHFQYLHFISSANVTDVSDNDLWKLVLQLSTIEPCIRHVALGMAMLYQIYNFIGIKPYDPTYFHIYYAGIKHYSKAVKALKERLAYVKGKADTMIWEISLLASFLFTCFEVLIGNEYGTCWQMYSGFKLIQSALLQQDAKSTALSLPGNLGVIALAWNRLDIQAATFSLWYDAKALFLPSVPESFRSLNHAKDVLDVITSNILQVIRTRGAKFYEHFPSHESIHGDLRAKLTEVKTALQYWIDNFEGFLISSEVDFFEGEHLSLEDIRDKISHHTLMIQYWLSFIWLYTAFSTVQTVFDLYMPAFTTIVDLAQEIIKLQAGRHWYYNLTAGTQVIRPLAFVAMKCRDGNLRRRANALLANAGREGAWDGQYSAAFCAWIIAREEEGLEEGIIGSVEMGSRAFVEERYRLKGATVLYNRLERMLKIGCNRERADRSDEVIEGFKNWGIDRETKGVLYGEPDELWQSGALFG